MITITILRITGKEIQMIGIPTNRTNTEKETITKIRTDKMTINIIRSNSSSIKKMKAVLVSVENQSL